jgi:hypothetical protein
MTEEAKELINLLKEPGQKWSISPYLKMIWLLACSVN